MIRFDNKNIPDFQKATAFVTGFRENTIRIILPDGTETALATVTYSRCMSAGLKTAVAVRIAEMWNANKN